MITDYLENGLKVFFWTSLVVFFIGLFVDNAYLLEILVVLFIVVMPLAGLLSIVGILVFKRKFFPTISLLIIVILSVLMIMQPIDEDIFAENDFNKYDNTFEIGNVRSGLNVYIKEPKAKDNVNDKENIEKLPKTVTKTMGKTSKPKSTYTKPYKPNHYEYEEWAYEEEVVYYEEWTIEYETEDSYDVDLNQVSEYQINEEAQREENKFFEEMDNEMDSEFDKMMAEDDPDEVDYGSYDDGINRIDTSNIFN